MAGIRSGKSACGGKVACGGKAACVCPSTFAWPRWTVSASARSSNFMTSLPGAGAADPKPLSGVSLVAVEPAWGVPETNCAARALDSGSFVRTNGRLGLRSNPGKGESEPESRAGDIHGANNGSDLKQTVPQGHWTPDPSSALTDV